jgi:hypothetical protein
MLRTTAKHVVTIFTTYIDDLGKLYKSGIFLDMIIIDI